MSSVTLDQALDLVMQLSLEQREMLVEILKQRDVEARREEIAREARASLEAYHRGEFKPLSAQDAIKALHDALDEDE